MVLHFHKTVQEELLSLFKKDGAQPEASLLSGGRRADVYVPARGVIFEIQVSPISLYEVKRRIKDYESLGLEIVWILHTTTFDPEKPSLVQQFLSKRNTYYCNHKKQGYFFDIAPFNYSKNMLCTRFEVELETLQPIIHTKLTSMYRPFATLFCKDDWLYEVRFDEHVKKFALLDYIPFRVPLSYYNQVKRNIRDYINREFFLLYFDPSEEEQMQEEGEDVPESTENTKMLVKLVLGE